MGHVPGSEPSHWTERANDLSSGPVYKGIPPQIKTGVAVFSKGKSGWLLLSKEGKKMADLRKTVPTTPRCKFS